MPNKKIAIEKTDRKNVSNLHFIDGDKEPN